MIWTTRKIVALVLATSVLTSICNDILIRRNLSSSSFLAGPSRAGMMPQGGMATAGSNPQFEPADSQAMAELDSKVKGRQATKDTVNEFTVNLKPYVNCKLTDPLADDPEEKDNTMEELPAGVHIYGGVPFDVEGLVQLNGSSIQGHNKLWPLEITNLVVNHAFKKLHLLHGAFHIDGPGAHITFAQLILHYADGSQETLDLVGGTHALRCTSQAVPPMLHMLEEPQTETGWIGSNPYLKKNNPGAMLHLYRATLNNPKPDVEVTGIDYLSSMVNPGPFMAGLTVE